ncbi:MAG: MBL fold metallo-hydrolase, partial [Bdellovibrionaceae bacterium]|nr:MBL fold metallo-hydrolase [Pseudobdellovibrionaceae bacterium]
MEHFLLYQLFEKETSTYTYLLADPNTQDAVIIDSTIDKVERDLKLINELSLNLKYILETHVHADHITGASALKKATGAQIALSAQSNAIGIDFPLNDGDEILFGSLTLTAFATPGHTNSCMSYY